MVCPSVIVVVVVVHRKPGYFDIYKSKRVVKGTELSKSAKKRRIYAPACFSPSTSATNRDFYTPCLFATPTEATQLCTMTWALMYRKGSLSHKLHSIYGARGQQCMYTIRLEHAMQLHTHSARRVCALERSSFFYICTEAERESERWTYQEIAAQLWTYWQLGVSEVC